MSCFVCVLRWRFSGLWCIVLSRLVCKFSVLPQYMELFYQTRAHEHQGNTPLDLLHTFLQSSVDWLDILVKGALTVENVLVHLCVSASTDLVHHHREYFFPTCIHCATNWTNVNYWWGKTLFWQCWSILDSALQLAGFPSTSYNTECMFSGFWCCHISNMTGPGDAIIMGQNKATYLLLIGPEATASFMGYNMFSVALLNLSLLISLLHAVRQPPTVCSERSFAVQSHRSMLRGNYSVVEFNIH